MRLKYYLFFTILLGCTFAVKGQSIFQSTGDERHLQEESYPQEYSQENFSLPGEEIVYKRATFTKPPNVPVRPMAEWEEIDAITITWTEYPVALAQIVKFAQLECKVYINCKSEQEVRNKLEEEGVGITENVIFLEKQNFNSVWIRDYGPNSVYLNDVDSLILVDWIYNRAQRPADDVLPAEIANHLDIPLYETTEGEFRFTATGGNFMSDGIGNGFSSRLVIDENLDKEEEEIDKIMQEFMGIQNYTKFDKLVYDGIHHIDMHMKLLDEERFIFGQYPEGKGDHDIIEANIEYLLATEKNAFGEPYEIIRVPIPPDFNLAYPSDTCTGPFDTSCEGVFRTYTNALFINNTILVPTYETKHDTIALRIWKETMPGFNIVGINCNSMIKAFGAIHCVTKEIGVRDPLRIVFQKIKDQEYSKFNGYKLEAIVQHRSGIAAANLFYRLKGEEAYKQLEMELSDPVKSIYQARIPDFVAQGTVEYYVQGLAINGKLINRPQPAPKAYYDFEIKEKVNSTSNALQLAFSQSAFPNPSSGLVCIPIELANALDGELSLLDIHGKLVKTIHSGKISAGTSKHFLNVASYPAGIYAIRFTNLSDSHTQKLVVK